MAISLEPGFVISHYRVLSLLGAGGMGEVYKARDESLGRAVALKILPPELVSDELRVRRFVLEAKSASSLNHPHIVTIHEIGKAEVRLKGASESASGAVVPIHFIAMELVIGTTLRDLIHGQAVALPTLLRYVAQAADGLAKAHAAGIVHRDLKPANIMVTDDGYTKVLDFGLAKLIERPDAGLAENPEAVSTVTHGPTGEGAVLGTVAYMSPEQVVGKAVDYRSDIFSFGCILYEAATGRRPFVSDSDVETMHMILKENPAPIEELNAEVPVHLGRLIRRCLAKSPDKRLQSMKDLALELSEIVEEYDRLPTTPESGAVLTGSSRFGPRGSLLRRVGATTAVVVGITGLIGGGWFVFQRREDAGQPRSSLQAMNMTRLASFEDLQDAAVSPDGRYLTYALNKSGKFSIWVRQIATGSDIEILPPQERWVGDVRCSPDGNYVYFGAVDPRNSLYSVLYQVPSLGGTPRKILYDIDSGVAFSPDGRRLAFVRWGSKANRSSLIVANTDGTAERELAGGIPPNHFVAAPSWSPDGTRLVTARESLEGGVHIRLVEFALSDGRETPIGQTPWDRINDLSWLPDGSGLAVTGSTGDVGDSNPLWFVSYPEGTPRRITNDLNTYRGTSVSADSKTLATIQIRKTAKLWSAPVANPDAARQILSGSGTEEDVSEFAASPVGTIICKAWGEGKFGIWSLDVRSGRRKRLTPDGLHMLTRSVLPPASRVPAVARNADVILLTAARDDRIPHVWRMDSEGENFVQLTNGDGEAVCAVSPDGLSMIFMAKEGLLKAALAGGPPVKIGDAAPEVFKYSPDGKYLLRDRFREENGRLKAGLEVSPSVGGAPIRTLDWQVDLLTQYSNVDWAPSGDALIYIREVGGVGNLWSQPLAGGEPKPITNFKNGHLWEYDFSNDGKQLFFTRGELSTDVVLISNFR